MGLMRNATSLNWVQRCLWTAGFVALGYCAYVQIEAWTAQTKGNQDLDHSLHVTRTSPATLPEGTLVGRLEVPRLGMSVVIFEGTGDNILAIGAGHLPGSPLPGQNGNVVLAAHRDTFFRPLRKIHPHDLLTVTTTEGTRQYQVESMRIVNPNQTEVLAPDSQSVLTLITCYPFEYFGHAPRRFVVRAKRIDPGAITG